jgi:cytoskeletal protein CcmA (bactofilin family)
MFKRKAKVLTSINGIDSIISKGTIVHGSIASAGALKVCGEVNGRITAFDKTVTLTVCVEQDAVVHADIDATSVIIGGTVFGKIRAKSVFIQKTGHVGDIEYELLQVEAGAHITGLISALPCVGETTEVNNVEPIRSIKT